MKRFAITTIICILFFNGCQSADSTGSVPDIHTTRISVDWNGVYYGEIPSASGSGIIVKITLSLDNSYELQYHYIDRPENFYTASGSFTWHSDGATITLEGLENYPKYYRVSADYMIQLDMKGRRITGRLADNYVLRKH